MVSGSNQCRLATITNPKCRLLSNSHAAGVEDTISQPSSQSDSSAIMKCYSYLGPSSSWMRKDRACRGKRQAANGVVNESNEVV